MKNRPITWLLVFVVFAWLNINTVLAEVKIAVFDEKTATENKNTTEIERITVDELKAKLAKGESLIIIDVRGKDYDTSDSKIKGALRFTGDLKEATANLSRDKEVVTYCSCSTDGGSVGAARVLREAGFQKVRALKGGWPAWKEAQGPTESK